MNIIKILAISLLCVLTFVQIAQAGAKATVVQVGEASITIPYPHDFIEVDEKSEIGKLKLSSVIHSQRTLALFMTPQDIDEYNKRGFLKTNTFFYVSDTRTSEALYISLADFDKVKGVIKSQQGNLIREAGNNGLFYETPNSLSIGMIVPYTVNGRSRDYRMAILSDALLIKGKIINTHTYAEYQSQQDLEWAKAASREFAKEIQQANAELTSPISGIPQEQLKKTFSNVASESVSMVVGPLFLFWLLRKKPGYWWKKPDKKDESADVKSHY